MFRNNALALMVLASMSAFGAEDKNVQYSCGPQPSNVPASVDERLKVDTKVKANALLKWIGSAELDTNVEKQKNELFQAHNNYDKYLIDSYFQWISCQLIIESADAGKIDRWREAYAAIYPQAKPDGSTNRGVPGDGGETTYISPELRAEIGEGHNGRNAETLQCYQPDNNYRFDADTAVLDVIQNSQNNGFPPDNVFQLAASPPPNPTLPNKNRICVHLVAKPTQNTHATIVVRLKVKEHPYKTP